MSYTNQGLHYEHIRRGTFLTRPNRFIAHVLPDGEREPVVCHVKNTGRCRELLVHGATVYVQEWENKPMRKTRFDLIAVEKKVEKNGQSKLINMDAQAPNALFRSWAEGGHFHPHLTHLRPECKWGQSRFDFYWEGKNPNLQSGYVEVKGVTLEDAGHARFPDAPTLRGVKHLEELIACREAGLEACVCFIIQMDEVDVFSPNDNTHPAFGEALRRAQLAGVEILALSCTVTPNHISVTKPVALLL